MKQKLAEKDIYIYIYIYIDYDVNFFTCVTTVSTVKSPMDTLDPVTGSKKKRKQ